jgi:hypothetical protein
MRTNLLDNGLAYNAHCPDECEVTHTMVKVNDSVIYTMYHNKSSVTVGFRKDLSADEKAEQLYRAFNRMAQHGEISDDPTNPA